MRQLGLDGRETEHPVTQPRPLSDRQRGVLAYMRAVDVVRPLDVGIIMHGGRERALGCTCWDMDPCQYASSDGVDALKRLERRGLVERVARGKWRVAVHDEGEW